MPTKKLKSNIILFNINGFNGSENYPSQKDLNILNAAFEIPGIKQGRDINYTIKDPSIMQEIVKEAAAKDAQPIINIQFDNNNISQSLFTKLYEWLEELKKTKITTCLSFNHYNTENGYNTENKELKNNWPPLFSQVKQVFFANPADQEAAIASNQITADKATNIQSISTSLNEEVKKLKQDTRLAVINVPLDNAEVITDLIMTKFNIGNDNAIDKKNLKSGIMMEVDGIIKHDGNASAKLEQYISDISLQFEKDRTNSNQEEIYKENPIDIYLSPKSELPQNTYNVSQKLHEMQHENTKRLEAALTQWVAKPAIQNSIPQARSQTTASERIHDLTNPEHLYSDDEITNIIKKSIDEQKVSVIDYASLGAQELLKDTIKNSLQDLQDSQKDVVLIPLNSGHEHWISLAIKRDKNNNIEFIYNDPTGNSITNRSELEKIIKEIVPNPTIHDLKIHQQQNDKDCGPFVVDNLIKIATGKAILTEEESKGTMGTKLRQDQQSILAPSSKVPPVTKELRQKKSMIEELKQDALHSPYSGATTLFRKQQSQDHNRSR